MSISTKEIAKLKNISIDKVKKMAPYIEGSKQCPHCKQWDIPENSRALYIPDLRKYKRDAFLRPYYYILEAIASKTEIIEVFTGINEQTKKAYIEELKEEGLIKLIESPTSNTSNSEEFILTIKAKHWLDSKNEFKRKIIEQVSPLVTEGMKAITALLMIINKCS